MSSETAEPLGASVVVAVAVAVVALLVVVVVVVVVILVLVLLLVAAMLLLLSSSLSSSSTVLHPIINTRHKYLVLGTSTWYLVRVLGTCSTFVGGNSPTNTGPRMVGRVCKFFLLFRKNQLKIK